MKQMPILINKRRDQIKNLLQTMELGGKQTSQMTKINNTDNTKY